jgi:hypothetical protein
VPYNNGGERLVALALFVARVFADDADHSLAANDAAGFTEFFYRRTNFHGKREGGGALSRSQSAGFEIADGPDGETKTPLRAQKGPEAGGDP